MKFNQILAGVTWLVLSEHKVTYGRIKREFSLDEQALDDVRHELIQIKRCVIDVDGEFLVWAGTATNQHVGDQTASPQPLLDQQPSDGVVAAQHRQLTVMFCDLVDSTDLSGRLGP